MTMRKVLLGVTGSIAAYKSAEIIRNLQQKGYSVQVVMTERAQAFITPLTLQTLSKHPVHCTQSIHTDSSAMEHIKLARWADLILVAPASANFIAKLAHGLADNLLSALCLASQADIIIAPAMNTYMWNNPANQDNCKLLKQRNITLLKPDAGEQACGEYGTGRMMAVQSIIEHICSYQNLVTAPSLRRLPVLISAGPTHEPLDPIRYLTNTSSGKMGYALARAAYEFGYQVTLVSGPTQLTPPPHIHYIPITTAQQMLTAIKNIFEQQAIFISTAAVSDYRPETYSTDKLKKTDTTYHTTWVRNPDIISTLNKQASKRPFIVGFAAETSKLLQRARAKLANKNLDMIAANLITPDYGFDSDDNALTVIWDGGQQDLCKQPKDTLATSLLHLITKHYLEKQ